MQNSELISVIIPFYNAESTLGQCIDSVIRQTYANIEIILVDDGSTDQSASVYLEYQKKDSRIYIVHKENGGLADARNTGVKQAKGEFIYFLDADDWIEPMCLEKALSLFELENDIDLVVFGHYINDGEKDVSVSKNALSSAQSAKAFTDIPKSIFLLESADRFPYAWNKLYRASIIKENAIEAGVRFTMAEDRDFNTQYFRKIRECVVTDIPLYHYIKKGDYSSLSNRYNDGVYEIVDEISHKRLLLYQELGMTSNAEYMQQFYNSSTEYFHVCVSNCFRKGAPKGFKVKKQLFKQLYTNELLKECMRSYHPSDIIRKLFVVLYKINSPGLSVVVYSALFGIENNFSSLYRKLRRTFN